MLKRLEMSLRKTINYGKRKYNDVTEKESSQSSVGRDENLIKDSFVYVVSVSHRLLTSTKVVSISKNTESIDVIQHARR